MNSKNAAPAPLLTLLRSDPLVTGLVVTLAASLLTSWTHLAGTFRLFFPGERFSLLMGGVAATAIDGTLFVLALTLGDLARLGWRRTDIYGGLVALLGISAVFNLDAALTNLAGGTRPLYGATVFSVDYLDVVRAVVGAASVPLMGAYLTHGLSLVGEARAEAFRDEERDVLEELERIAERDDPLERPPYTVVPLADPVPSRDDRPPSRPSSSSRNGSTSPGSLSEEHLRMRDAISEDPDISLRALATAAGYQSPTTASRNFERAGIYRDSGGSLLLHPLASDPETGEWTLPAG